jgi:hypothetical protein
MSRYDWGRTHAFSELVDRLHEDGSVVESLHAVKERSNKLNTFVDHLERDAILAAVED